jgi:hypothetical protein
VVTDPTEPTNEGVGADAGVSPQLARSALSSGSIDPVATIGADAPPPPPKEMLSRKPDYVKFRKNREALIKSLLGQPVSANDINRGFSQDFAFYFVLGDYFAITQNMNELFETLKKLLPSPEYPSKDCITCLRNGRALSLFEILRLHLALERLRTSKHAFYITQVSDTSAPLIGDGAIVPSLRLIDLGTLERLQELHKVSDKVLLQTTESVLKKRMRPDFISLLKKGQPVGSGRDKSTNTYRPYRVTDYLAAALCAAFEGATDLKGLKVAIDSYFPTDPTAGPGNGRWTVALPEALGNHIAFIP